MSPEEIASFLAAIENALEAQIDELKVTLMLVRDEKKRFETAPAIGKRLAVPWLSQLSETAVYARGDCGTACVAMVLTSRGKPVTVDQVSKATHRQPGFTLLSFTELILSALTFGLTLTHQREMTIAQMIADVDAGKPVIALLNYRSIPATLRFDSQYNSGHYVVVVGYDDANIIYHDPYWRDEAGGAFKALQRNEFEAAYSAIAPGNSYARHALRID